MTGPELELIVTRATGYGGIFALLITLVATPLGIDQFRRRLGLVTAFLAVVHTVWAIITPLVPDVLLLVYEPHLRAGAVTTLILAILAVTSFPKILKVRGWKYLHRTVYAAALLSFLHLLLSPHAPQLAVLGLGAMVALLLLLRLLPRKRRG